MIFQLFVGSVLISMTIAIAAVGFWLSEGLATRVAPWAVRPPHSPKLTLVLVGAVLMILLLLTLSVWLWALAFVGLGVFTALEPAVYYSIVAFTTLGYGDIILPLDWRILGGMTAVNGLLNIGLYTALMVEILRRVRSEQSAGKADEE